MKSKEGVDKLMVEGTVYEDALKQAEVMNKSFQTERSRRRRSKTTDGKPRCKKSTGSRWSVKLDNERMHKPASRKVT